jgi:hypothetical protein
MTEQDTKRLEEIRAQFNEVKGFSSGQTWNDKLEFLFTLIDEQADEVERLKGEAVGHSGELITSQLQNENQRLSEIIQKLKTDACVCSETEKCIYCIEIEAALEGKNEKDNAK